MTLGQFWTALRGHRPWLLVGPTHLIRNEKHQCPLMYVGGCRVTNWSGLRASLKCPEDVGAVLGMEPEWVELLTHAADNLPRLYRKQGWGFDFELDLVADLRALMLDACGLKEGEN